MSHRRKHGSTRLQAPSVNGAVPVGGESKPAYSRRNALIIVVGLLLAVAAVFGQTALFRFVNYDDDQYVYDNRNISEGLTWRGVSWALSNSHVGNWHPLTSLTHMLDCEFYGLNPAGHHVTNVVLHALTVSGLFLLLLKMTRELWPSALAAALFAIHPLRAESVAWVSERKDVLSGALFVLTLLAYVRYVHRPFSKRNYLLVMGSFALALMAKPMVVTLPLVLLLLDVWPLRRARGSAPIDASTRSDVISQVSWKRLILEKILLLVLAGGLSLVTLRTQSVTIESIDRLPITARMINAVVAYATYVARFFWPFDLSAFYPHPRTTIQGMKFTASLLLLLGISAAVIALWRKRPYLGIGWLWFLGMLVPVIGLVQVGGQANADRYTYLPHIGTSIAIAWALAAWCRNGPYRASVVTAVSVLLLALLGLRAADQTAHWRSSESLWTHALACTKRNHVAYLNLGTVVLEQGKIEKAMSLYAKALEIRPQKPEALANYGEALGRLGRLDEAIPYMRRALQANPRSGRISYNLGNLLVRKRKFAEAIACYEYALSLRPEFPEAHCNLATALDNSGKEKKAMIHWLKAIELSPQYADAHLNVGNVFYRNGKHNEAIIHLRQAVELDPKCATGHFLLGNIHYLRGQKVQAIEHYRQAVRIKPSYVEASQNLEIVLKERRSERGGPTQLGSTGG